MAHQVGNRFSNTSVKERKAKFLVILFFKSEVDSDMISVRSSISSVRHTLKILQHWQQDF